MNPLALFLYAPIAFAETAPPIDACAADAALLAALQVFLSEETGQEGAEALGRLGDVRAVAPLQHGARTRAEPIALASVRNLAGYGPEGVGALAGLLQDETPSQEVRKAAAHALGLASRPDAADALVSALEIDLPRSVRAEVVETIRRWYPDRAAGLERVVARDGTAWLVAGGATGFGMALGAAGHFGQADLETVGVLTGGLAGGTLGFVGGRVWPMEAGDAAFLTTSGMASTLGGIMIANAVHRSRSPEDSTAAMAAGVDPYGNGSSDAAWLGGLLGDLGGFGLGYALRERHPGSVQDAWEAVAASSASALGASTFMTFVDPDFEYAAQMAGGIGFIAGMGLGHAAAPSVNLTDRDLGLLALGTTYGTLLGSLVPTGDRNREGLGVAGLAAGYLASYGLAVPVEMPGDVTTGAFSGLALGSLAGWGTGLMLPNPDGRISRAERQTVSAITLAGGTAGAALGGYLTWHNPAGIAANDVVLSSVVTGWAGWQAIGWWNVVDQPEDQRGWMPLAPALAGSAAAIASPLLDVDVERTLPAASLGLWGVYVGAAGAVLTDAEKPLAWSLTGSDVGLGLGALLMSPWVNASPLVVALADAGGVVGVAVGLFAANFATDETDPLLIASLVGGGVGAAGGALAGVALQARRPETREALGLWRPAVPDLPGTWSLAPATLADGDRVAWGASLTATGW
ncbi:MAG: HEAT repeat domain-containing protein [Deltaproteobacteria bacterium]|nr:HEAT repeat domain-containing protein [Deltaproteobacteria bacterium]